MEIESVLWDSDFFGYPVGRVLLGKDEKIDGEKCKTSPFKLLYIISEQALDLNVLQELPLQLADCKTELEAITPPQPIHPHAFIQPIFQLNKELLDLVYESGHYSRFKLDKGFTHKEFERMYLHWIEKVLGDNKQQVFGFIEQEKIIGFITLEEKLNAANIGLIAVNETQRGKSIGAHLINQSKYFAQKQHLPTISVTTQLANEGAMRFYQQQGFEVVKKTYIYHLWK